MHRLRLTKFPVGTDSFFLWAFAGHVCVFAEDGDESRERDKTGWMKFRFASLRSGEFRIGESFKVDKLRSWQLYALCVAIREETVVIWHPHCRAIHVYESGATRRIKFQSAWKSVVPVFDSGPIAWAVVERGDQLALFDGNFARIASVDVPWEDIDLDTSRYVLGWEKSGSGCISLFLYLDDAVDHESPGTFAYTTFSSERGCFDTWTEFCPNQEFRTSSTATGSRFRFVAWQKEQLLMEWNAQKRAPQKPCKPRIVIDSKWKNYGSITLLKTARKWFGVYEPDSGLRWFKLRHNDIYVPDQLLP
jgi:hypothetical protein